MLGKKCANMVYNKDSVSFSDIAHKNEKKIIMQFVVRAHKGEHTHNYHKVPCCHVKEKDHASEKHKGGISQPNTILRVRLLIVDFISGIYKLTHIR